MYVDLEKIFAIVCIAYVWSLLDKVRWNYPTTIFAKIPGKKLQKWLDPRVSQSNKWIFKSKILDIIFSTVLVWATDLWHLIKMGLLVTIFYFLWRFQPENNIWIELLLMFVVYGIVFEMNYQMDWFWWIKKHNKK